MNKYTLEKCETFSMIDESRRLKKLRQNFNDLVAIKKE